MVDNKYIAHRYGITERMETLNKALLSIKGVTELNYDLSGYLDDIYQVIVIAKYKIDSDSISKYYEAHGKIQKEIVRKAKTQLLTRTEDAIEDMGEHFYFVFSSEKWNDNREYALFYENGGKEIPVGTEGWVPTRAIANKLLSYHESRKVLEDREIYLKERIKERLYQPMKRYNGKPVYNYDYLYWNALSVGDYVDEEVCEYIKDCITPACNRSDCIQLGEAQDQMLDEDGNLRNVYLTLKTAGYRIYEFCGRCFRGENTERGTVPSYI